ncbi:type IV pilus modification protein PilV [Marinobacter lacisalsi]|uniref:Type IV pilus modification protein PilV n=1 Tax=Marinobacter lacisalsi TaxID=475979 RepID=A0ABV8QK68_9GAMM
MTFTDLTHEKSFQRGKGAKQSGIALIEVLVAVLVLGVGLLGIAAMQSVSSQMTNGAEQRTQAILLSADMLDRIRANGDNMASYNNLVVNPDNVNCATDFAYNNGQTIAQNDISEWSNQVVCALPRGRANVAVTAAGVATVTIDWQRQDPDGQPVTVTTEL